jgi:hypothetical protein
MMLKNYTSSIPVERSVSMIEMMLAKRGANQILKTYDPKGNPVGVAFRMTVRGTELGFKLPSRVDSCRKILVESMSPRSRTKREMVAKVEQQSARTAWKILYDWTEAQMAMIDLAQVEMAEVFMPYMLVNGETTVFQAFAERGFKAMLGDGSSQTATDPGVPR